MSKSISIHETEVFVTPSVSLRREREYPITQDVMISLDATMKMILEFQEESSKRVKKFERKPCEHCENVDTYSRQCVECGLNVAEHTESIYG